MDDQATLALDPTEVRTAPEARRAPPRRGVRVALLAGAAALCLAAGAGAGAYFARPDPARARLADVKAGPIAPMPEIRDGVPAVMDRAAVRVISTTPPDKPLPASVTTPPAELKVAAPAAAVVPFPATGAPAAAAPAVAVLPAARPAPAPRATAEIRFAPPEAPAPVNLSAPEIRKTAAPSEAAPPVADRPATTATIPLPPFAPERSAARRTEPAAATAVPPRLAVAATPPRARPAAAPSAVPPPVAAPAPAEPDRVEVFGVALPLIPTGRQIREAAQSFADAVTSLPEKF